MRSNRPDERRGISVPAYLAAVAVGCVIVGALLAVGLGAQWPFGFGAAVPVALLAGLFPGLLLCLPATLLSAYLAKRFRLFGARWYGLFGALTGGTVAMMLAVAMQPDTGSGFLGAVLFITAGALAGLAYRWVERREQESRNQRQTGTR